MIVINNVAPDIFSVNGSYFHKNFMSDIYDTKLRIFNAYDTEHQIVPWTRYDQFTVDGVSFGNASDLQKALVPILFVKGTGTGDGGGTGSSEKNGVLAGYIEHISGYQYRFVATKYQINGVVYTTPIEAVITLDPADATHNRIDLIIIELVGGVPQISVINGVAATPAAKPVLDDVETQIEFTFITVAANTTEPSDVNTTLVFNEFAQEVGGELDCTTASSAIFPLDETDPFDSVKDIWFNNTPNGDNITFTSSTPITPAGKNLIIKFKQRVLQNYKFEIGLGSPDQVSSIVIEGTDYGLDPNNVTDYQSLIIPLTDISTQSFTRITITNRRNGGDYFMDYIRIQEIPSINLEGYLTRGGYTGTAQDLKDEIDALAGSGSSKFLGTYTSLANLQAAHPTASDGNYADVDAGVGTDVQRYVWDNSDSQWVAGGTGGGLGDQVLPQTEITANTTISGTRKGLSKVYPVNAETDVEITVDKGTYVPGDVVNFKRRGSGGVSWHRGVNVRLEGKRGVDNIHRLANKGNLASVLFDRLDGSVLVGAVLGDIQGGYLGAPSVVSADLLIEGDVAKDLTIIGSGFSENMVITMSGGATFNSWTFVSDTQITINATATGVEYDPYTIKIDNGDVLERVEAIAGDYLFESHSFEYGWGLIKMKSSQVNAVEIRRSSDNATTNVQFDSNGKVSLSSPVEAGGDLTTWAGSDNVFIVKLYNQGNGGSSFDIEQATAANQPKLLNAGALIVNDGRTMFEFDGSNDYLQSSGSDTWRNNDISVFADVRAKSAHNGNIIGHFLQSGGGTTPQRMLQFRYDSTNTIRAVVADETGGSNTQVDGPATVINTNYKTTLFDNGNSTVYVNGVAGTSGTSPANRPSESKPFQVGGLFEIGSTYLDGFMSYVVFFKSDKEAEISDVQSLIDSYL
ncbi:LamG domain-containing protein [Aegicerativicinus sediminis]|uniref:LamG domain-containing protein n=1 Tax=Aegicerativicinus sediminis TaxID=2893202 RepID=UPI001E310AAB|nr:LamG domain-containing protein [Aegicerativicinus sediminis]